MDLYGKYHHLIEQATQTGLWEYDYTSGRMSWSEHIYTIFACASDYIPTTESDSRFYTAASLRKLTQSITILEEFKHAFTGEFKILDSQGKLKMVELTMDAEFSGNKISRRFGTIRDITQQHNETIESKFFKERVGLALKASAIGTWDYHVNGDRLYWDECMLDIFGLAPYSTVEHFSHWLDLIHPEDRNNLIEQFNTLAKGMADQNTVHMTCRIISPLGRIAFINIHAQFYLEQSSQSIRILGTCTDATDAELNQRYFINQASVSQQKMLQAQGITAIRTRFLANMTHEIRTPMNAIMGALQILQTYDLDPDSLSLTDIALDSSKDLLAIINDILDLSKIDAQQMKIENIPIQVDEIARLTFKKFQVCLTKNIQLQLNIAPDFNPARMGDSLRIKQIINNLLSNAIKFTHHGSIIFSMSGNSHGIEITVSDTGIGIPKDKLQEIFEPFQQADDSTTRSYGGTGLGLAICASLTKLMGGTLQLVSEQGVGSVFTLYLPLSSSISWLKINQ